MSLDVEIKCRVTREMKELLQFLAHSEGSGVNISDLIRRALEQTYPVLRKTYPLREVSGLKAAGYPGRERKKRAS